MQSKNSAGWRFLENFQRSLFFFFWGGRVLHFFVKLLIVEQIEPKQCSWKPFWQKFLHVLINVHLLSIDVTQYFLCEFVKSINATHCNYHSTHTTLHLSDCCWAFSANGPFMFSPRPLTGPCDFLRLEVTAPPLGSECIWQSVEGLRVRLPSIACEWPVYPGFLCLAQLCCWVSSSVHFHSHCITLNLRAEHSFVDGCCKKIPPVSRTISSQPALQIFVVRHSVWLVATALKLHRPVTLSHSDSWACSCRRLGLMASIGRLLFQTSTAARGPRLPFVFPLALLTASRFRQREVHQYMRRCMTERGWGRDKELTCWQRQSLPTKSAADLLLSRSECLHGWTVKQVHRCVLSFHHVLHN